MYRFIDNFSDLELIVLYESLVTMRFTILNHPEYKEVKEKAFLFDRLDIVNDLIDEIVSYGK